MTMSFGTQRNGLPIECKQDRIGVHDYADETSWVNGPTDSSFVIDPSDENAPAEYKNKVVKLVGMQLDLAQDIEMPAGSEMLVEFYGYVPSDGWATEMLLKTITYSKMKDWANRSHLKTPIPDALGEMGDYNQYDIAFPDPPTFWPTKGYDAAQSIKLTKMVVRIANNQPYKKKSDNQVNAAIAKPCYFVEIYEAPDV